MPKVACLSPATRARQFPDRAGRSTPAPTSPAPPSLVSGKKASESAEMGKIKKRRGGGDQEKLYTNYIIQLYIMYILICCGSWGSSRGGDPWKAPGKEHAVANTPGCVGLGDCPQKEVWRERSRLPGERTRSGALPDWGQLAGCGDPQVCDPWATWSGYYGNRPRRRAGKPAAVAHPRHPPKGAAGAAERGRGTGRGAPAGPARSFLPPRPGCAPPRAAAAEQPAGPSEPLRRAAGSGSGSASEPPPAGLGAGRRCLPAAQLEFKETGAARGRGRGPASGTPRPPPAPSPSGPSQPCEKSFLRGRLGERPKLAPASSPECRTQAASRVIGIFFPLPGRLAGEMICMLNKSGAPIFSSARFRPCAAIFSMKAPRDKCEGVTFMSDSGRSRMGLEGSVWQDIAVKYLEKKNNNFSFSPPLS